MLNPNLNSIALIQNIVVLWEDAVIVAKKYLEGVGTGSRFKTKTNIRMRIIGWVRCKRLIPSGYDSGRLSDILYLPPGIQQNDRYAFWLEPPPCYRHIPQSAY